MPQIIAGKKLALASALKAVVYYGRDLSTLALSLWWRAPVMPPQRGQVRQGERSATPVAPPLVRRDHDQ